jgi:hypothetical protein
MSVEPHNCLAAGKSATDIAVQRSSHEGTLEVESSCEQLSSYCFSRFSRAC